MKELVFGHKNPDTDAIVAAKAYSYLQNKLGADTEAVALGEPNEETQFVLDYFNEPAPRVIIQVQRVARNGGRFMIPMRTPFNAPIAIPSTTQSSIATTTGTLLLLTSVPPINA